MRHRVKGRKLGRTASHRAATLKALATSLLKHKKIRTTLAKAKETRSFVQLPTEDMLLILLKIKMLLKNFLLK